MLLPSVPERPESSQSDTDSKNSCDEEFDAIDDADGITLISIRYP